MWWWQVPHHKDSFWYSQNRKGVWHKCRWPTVFCLQSVSFQGPLPTTTPAPATTTTAVEGEGDVTSQPFFLHQVSAETVKLFSLERVAGGELLGQSSTSLLPPPCPPLSWSSRQTCPWPRSLSGTQMWPRALGNLSLQPASPGLEGSPLEELSPLVSRFSPWYFGQTSFFKPFPQVNFKGNTEPEFTSVKLNGVRLCWFPALIFSYFIFIQSVVLWDLPF